MSKRDRAARAKGAADDTATDSVEGLESRDDVEETGSESSELRPSGKRSSRRRSSAGASTTDSGAESDSGSAVAVKERKKKADAGQSRNPFARIWLFLQQVVAELKKVIWPTRREMITYTIVVLVFVVIMTAFISGLDVAFAKLVLWMFG